MSYHTCDEGCIRKQATLDNATPSAECNKPLLTMPEQQILALCLVYDAIYALDSLNQGASALSVSVHRPVQRHKKYPSKYCSSVADFYEVLVGRHVLCGVRTSIGMGLKSATCFCTSLRVCVFPFRSRIIDYRWCECRPVP